MMLIIITTATSALDAESETLVNQALGALLQGNNTTISIAHRLSTIKRSDTIIVLSSDGKVAQQGSYEQLSQDPNSAFSQLMEWQMSGGETGEEGKGKPESQLAVTETGIEDDGDIVEAMVEETEREMEDDDEGRNHETGLETAIEKIERAAK